VAANNFGVEHVKFMLYLTNMKKLCAIVAIGLLSPCAVSKANAEGPLHWTARHVKQAAAETGDTISNVARTAGRTIYHRTRPIREALE
jgi:hypothetical protein